MLSLGSIRRHAERLETKANGALVDETVGELRDDIHDILVWVEDQEGSGLEMDDLEAVGVQMELEFIESRLCL